MENLSSPMRAQGSKRSSFLEGGNGLRGWKCTPGGHLSYQATLYKRAVPLCSQKLSLFCTAEEHHLFSESQLWFFRQGEYFADAWGSWPETVILETLLYFTPANGTQSTLWLQTNPWTSHCITWAIFRNFQFSPSTIRRASGLISPKLPVCIAILAELLLILQQYLFI